MSGVVFEGVTKRFGEVVAVDDLTLEIADQEFMVLLGPSGCGKTTALRMIAGLDDVTAGVLRIGDRVVNDIDAKDRDIAMVFQSYALYPHMTVRKNVESPLLTRAFPVDDGAPRKLTGEEREKRVKEAAATLGLSDLLDRKPGALSGGQRQRVALARSIVRRPEVFLMDEPLSNLDAKLRAQTRVELVELHRRLATTFIYVTHDQVEAMTMASRIAIIENGRLQQVGRPQDVYERPANLFVARFIGNPPMNTLPALFSRNGTASQVVCGETRLSVSEPGSAADGQAVDFGVRPEHLTVAADGLPAEVKAVEMLGHERHLVCDVNGAAVVIRQPTEGAPPQPGEVLHLSADPAEVHLFDAETSERLN
ncbi:MAG: ABC transporter ATP-binding protein [Actinobacteria bacterium]|nr:MAG: ABC transporter ATP-binding protein [Actinomycetota bacterium]RIK07123.1 MAG: sugar ABC transporter ATP-binding protein [Acidobacteriota bacterium]